MMRFTGFSWRLDKGSVTVMKTAQKRSPSAPFYRRGEALPERHHRLFSVLDPSCNDPFPEVRKTGKMPVCDLLYALL